MNMSNNIKKLKGKAYIIGWGWVGFHQNECVGMQHYIYIIEGPEARNIVFY